MVERDALSQSRAASLPAAPTDLKFELTKDFKAPQGVEFALDPNDPLVPQAQQTLHDILHGKFSPQEAMSKLVDLYAAGKVSDAQTIAAAHAEEVKKLGVNGTSRVTAAKTWLTSVVGKELADHMASSGMVTAAQVAGWETIMRRMTGGTPFSQAHRDTPEPNGKIQGYEKMSFEQRRAAQDAQNAQHKN